MSSERKSRPLSDDAMLIRGGTMQVSSLRRSALESRKELGRLGLSVWGADGMSPTQILEAVPRVFPFLVVRLSTAGAVRSAGFELEATGPRMHQTIWLPDETDDTLDMLVQRFGRPIRRADL